MIQPLNLTPLSSSYPSTASPIPLVSLSCIPYPPRTPQAFVETWEDMDVDGSGMIHAPMLRTILLAVRGLHVDVAGVEKLYPACGEGLAMVSKVLGDAKQWVPHTLFHALLIAIKPSLLLPLAQADLSMPNSTSPFPQIRPPMGVKGLDHIGKRIQDIVQEAEIPLRSGSGPFLRSRSRTLILSGLTGQRGD